MGTSPFSTIDKNLLSEKITAQILLLIRERQLKPGEKLPPERELAAILQVSRTALREAFRSLAMIGAIDSRQGDGTYVTSLEPELLFGQLEYVVALNESTFENLFEARRVLENGIIVESAEKITEDELDLLEQIIEKMENLDQENFAQFLVMDIEFHETIIKAARNPIYLSPYLTHIRRLGRVSRTINEAVPGLREQSHLDHRAIFDALKKHDRELSRQTMVEHMDHIAAFLHTISPNINLLSPTK